MSDSCSDIDTHRILLPFSPRRLITWSVGMFAPYRLHILWNNVISIISPRAGCSWRRGMALLCSTDGYQLWFDQFPVIGVNWRQSGWIQFSITLARAMYIQAARRLVVLCCVFRSASHGCRLFSAFKCISKSFGSAQTAGLYWRLIEDLWSPINRHSEQILAQVHWNTLPGILIQRPSQTYWYNALSNCRLSEKHFSVAEPHPDIGKVLFIRRRQAT